ncbi:MAG: DUF2029 domain-containing protein [Pirellulaceae bacterium]|nr:DUF2029 domain-containing protein [Pirellulaceae bacterium]
MRQLSSSPPGATMIRALEARTMVAGAQNAGGRWLAMACLLLASVIWLGNPNYHWSTSRDVPYGADFLQEWVAGDMLWQGAGHQIYDANHFANWQHSLQRTGFQWPEKDYYPAVYPPPYYCLVAPLAGLPYRYATILWLILMVTAYACSALCSERIWSLGSPHQPASGPSTPISSYSSWSLSSWPLSNWSLSCWLLSYLSATWWSIGLCLPAVFMGCVMGQKGCLWLLILALSVQLNRNGRAVAAGCVAGLLTLKPTLCFLLPVVMILNRQWRFCGGFILGATGLYGMAAAIVPWSMWQDYLQVISGAAGYQNHAGYRSGWSTSLLTLFSTLGWPKIVTLSLYALAAIFLVGRLIVRGDVSARQQRLMSPEYLFQLLATTALLSPHFYFYDLVWLLLPLHGLLVIDARRAIMGLAILWVSMLLGQNLELGWPVCCMALLSMAIRPKI